MHHHRFYINQLSDEDWSWVKKLLEDVASRYFKTKHYQDWIAFPDKKSSLSFFELPQKSLPLKSHKQFITVKTLLNEINQYDSLSWWKRLISFFTGYSSYIKKARTLVSFAGIRALFHYKQQIDSLTYRGIKTMLQKHEPKVPYQLGEITRAFFGDLENVNDKKDVVLRKKDEKEEELLKKSKNHLNSVYQSAKEQLQSALSDTIRFPDKKSKQLEWATIRQGLEKEVSAIEEYYKVAHWDKGSDECLPNDWLLSAQAGIEFIKRTHEEFELAPLIKRINAPDIKWQRATGQRREPQLTIGHNKAVQIIKWADAQLPYRPLFPDQASRWAVDKQVLLEVFKPMFDEMLSLKEADVSLYIAKQRALAENLATVTKKHRLQIETQYSPARAKKLLIPFDTYVYQDIQSFFNQLNYIVNHIDEVLDKHLQNESHTLLEEILNKSDIILDILAQGQSYLRNIIKLKEEFNQHAEHTLAAMDNYIAKVDNLAKDYSELEEKIAENDHRINQMIQGSKKNNISEVEEYFASEKKEMITISNNHDKRLKQIEQQLLAYLEKEPKLQKCKDKLLASQPKKAESQHSVSQSVNQNKKSHESKKFLLFKSNLTTQTPLPESDVSDNFYKY